MSAYTIFISGTVSASVEVEAESLEDAFDIALENAPQTDFAFAEFDGVEVWEADETSYYKDGEYIREDS